MGIETKEKAMAKLIKAPSDYIELIWNNPLWNNSLRVILPRKKPVIYDALWGMIKSSSFTRMERYIFEEWRWG
jgi:hypothetical protein